MKLGFQAPTSSSPTHNLAAIALFESTILYIVGKASHEGELPHQNHVATIRRTCISSRESPNCSRATRKIFFNKKEFSLDVKYLSLSFRNSIMYDGIIKNHIYICIIFVSLLRVIPISFFVKPEKFKNFGKRAKS